MEASTPSRTAMITSLMRAAHARTDPLPILDDPWGDRLAPPSALAAVQQRALAQFGPAEGASAVQAVVDRWLRSLSAYPHVVTRSRFAEDALAAAFARGVRQYVLIGAGFDSFALRRPPEFDTLCVIEIDHPATQSLKLERLAQCGVAVPPGVHYVPADLASESVGDALARSPFVRARPCFFSWLGVTPYLNRRSNFATFAAVASVAAAGSELAFSYAAAPPAAGLSPEAARRSADLREALRALGEPLLSTFDPLELARDLAALGLEIESDVSDAEMTAKYDPRGLNGFSNEGRSRTALALVGAAA